MAIKILVSLTIFLAGFLLGNFFPKRIFTPPLTVTNIVDGDTFDISDGRRVRLSGINAPENGVGTKLECLGPEAKSRLQTLTLNQKIRFEGETRFDNFGRAVAVVKTNSVDLGATLVAEGLAKVIGPFPTPIYQEKLLQLEEAAHQKELNLWNLNSCPPPIEPSKDCQIKGNIHWKKRQKLYFPPTCPSYNRIVIEPKNGDRWFCSVDEAQAHGFNLSSTCPQP